MIHIHSHTHTYSALGTAYNVKNNNTCVCDSIWDTHGGAQPFKHLFLIHKYTCSNARTHTHVLLYDSVFVRSFLLLCLFVFSSKLAKIDIGAVVGFLAYNKFFSGTNFFLFLVSRLQINSEVLLLGESDGGARRSSKCCFLFSVLITPWLEYSRYALILY